MAKSSALRFAIVSESTHLPPWARPVVSALLQQAQAVLWIQVEANSGRLKPLAVKQIRIANSVLHPFELVGATPDPSDLLAQAKAFCVDFVLCLAAGTLASRWHDVAEHGVWFFRFGESLSADAFGTDELSRGRNTQRATLERMGAQPGESEILKHGSFKTELASMSRHQNSIVEQCAKWPAQVAREMLHSGALSGQRVWREHPASARWRTAVARQSARWLLKLQLPLRRLMAVWAKIGRLFTYQQWNIGVLVSPLQNLLRPTHRPEIQWLPEPAWPYCYADPFPVKVAGKTYIVAEKYNFATDRGSIVSIALGEDGQSAGVIDTAMDFPFHVSYPCTVTVGANIYCVAETLERQEIAIYLCEKFPNIWTKVTTVVRGQKFADPTLFFHQNHWWILSTFYDATSGGNASMYAWWAPDIAGPWQPHLQNPIKCDVESSRSAGTPFFIDDRMYRPAQSCADGYGKSVVLNQIVSLTPTEFREQLVRKILPDRQYPDGFHHIGVYDGVVVVDGRRDLFYLPAAATKLKRAIALIGAKLGSPKTAGPKIAEAPVTPKRDAQRHRYDISP